MIWLPIMLVIVHKRQRFMALGFVLSCMLMMRLMAELMDSIGYPTGILPFMTSHVFYRGIVVYTVFYALYAALAYYSPNTRSSVFLAASISIFFVAGFAFALLMLL